MKALLTFMKNRKRFFILYAIALPLLLCSTAFTTEVANIVPKAASTISPAKILSHPLNAIDEVREQIIDFAKEYLGRNYGEHIGADRFDCSGFAQHVFKKYGFYLDRSSSVQALNGQTIPYKNAKMGDLVFFNSGSHISHVAMVVEAKEGSLIVIHSTNSRGIVIEDVLKSDYWTRKFAFVKDVLSTWQ